MNGVQGFTGVSCRLCDRENRSHKLTYIIHYYGLERRQPDDVVFLKEGILNALWRRRAFIHITQNTRAMGYNNQRRYKKN